MPNLNTVFPLAAPSEADGVSLDLFPATLARNQTDDWLTRRLNEAAGNIKAGGVAPAANRETAEADLARFNFESPAQLRDVLAWVVRQMEAGMVQMGHPRYFGLFNPAPTFPSQCADRIVAFFNAQLASATTSPLPVALERHVIAALAQRLGMPAATGGHFTTGGSEANATAVICSLTKSEPAYGQQGVYAFRGKPRLYVSQDSHLAWIKIAHQTGIGREAVCLVDTDGEGRMDAGALASALAKDTASGLRPVLIVSTAGTTGAGMIDHLDANAEIASRFGAWHHVDAAWGGGVVVADRLRGVLAGIERADSVTIDAHKWLATTMGCGMFLTSQPAVLADAFHVVMDCMPSNVADLDPYVTTMQWSRRFLGLRLFAGLATAGWEGYAEHIEHAVRLTDYLRDRLAAIGWQSVNKSPLAVTCLRPPAGSIGVRAIVREIVESGEAWVSTVEFEGELVIRVCITNGQTTKADIDHLVALLHQTARQGR